jgi:hypothetical protein
MISSWVDTIAIMKDNEGCMGIYSLRTKMSHCVPTVIRGGLSPKTNCHATMVIRSRLSLITSCYDLMVIMAKLFQKSNHYAATLIRARPSKKTSCYAPTVIRARLFIKTTSYPPMVIKAKLSNNMSETSFLRNDHMKHIFKMCICKNYTI